MKSEYDACAEAHKQVAERQPVKRKCKASFMVTVNCNDEINPHELIYKVNKYIQDGIKADTGITAKVFSSLKRFLFI